MGWGGGVPKRGGAGINAHSIFVLFSLSPPNSYGPVLNAITQFREMDQMRGKDIVMVSSSEEEGVEEEDDDDDDEEVEEEDDDDEEEDSDFDEASESESESESDDNDVDDSSLSDKVVSLLREGKDIQSLKLKECKAYLRNHGLRIAGNRDICVARIREHWRLKYGSGYTLYPKSSFTINCTGDVCTGDVVLFRQKVYEKFSKVTRHGKVIGNRTVAGRVVKESYGAAKQQHTFTVEVLWSIGVRKLPPLSPLLVKGRNLYKQKTYRQRWENEADRIEVLHEKHRRGAAARSKRALKNKKRSCLANECRVSKRSHEIHNEKRSKSGRSSVDNVRHQDGFRRANSFQPRATTSSTPVTWKENASSRASRYTGGSHHSDEFDRYQVPVYPSYDSYPQSTYRYHVNSQSRNVPSEFFYHNRGLIPPYRPPVGIPPYRPPVGEFTTRSQHLVTNHNRHTQTNPYDIELKNYGGRKYGI
ncbi:zinc finger CCCH domain-containing protein 62 isoform X2 [Vigna radiata var. radiata]|uniref:Zinc finger CCCH domain-containing protein 62 isoform X2 n=1 Tax=Vigna radiata var. radiata TaxID=3916 RepID=A0A1S3VNF4_VIGRR|nr:zinc finger CCCH domain-containing protein 62 isoform X2 [Vigna radiata var. radiata]